MNKLFMLAMTVAGFSTQVVGACTFEPWEQYNDIPLLKHSSGHAYLYVAHHLGIDADGAPNAYHPDDVGLHCTRGEGFKGLDCPANAGYPKTDWWPSVLVADPQDKKQALLQTDGDFAGFFVSQTTLFDPHKEPSDAARYVNATRIPYIVFPGRFHQKSGTGLIGDLGFAINLASKQSSAFVVADKGPSKAPLGEISIALAQALGGDNPNPRTGAGKPQGDIMYIVFPYSSRNAPWPMDAQEIAQRSRKLLSEVGGIDAALDCKERS